MVVLVTVASMWLSAVQSGEFDPSGSVWYPFTYSQKPRGGYGTPGRWWIGTAASRLRGLLPRRDAVNGRDGKGTWLERGGPFASLGLVGTPESS